MPMSWLRESMTRSARTTMRRRWRHLTLLLGRLSSPSQAVGSQAGVLNSRICVGMRGPAVASPCPP
eukprot:16222130-Heterocapsa_arctica.AAC.1